MGKVNKKTPDFHSFLGFFDEIDNFPGFFAVFWPLQPENSTCKTKTSMHQSHAQSRYLSPKSTFFFGAEAAAIGVLSASTTGAAILK